MAVPSITSSKLSLTLRCMAMSSLLSVGVAGGTGFVSGWSGGMPGMVGVSVTPPEVGVSATTLSVGVMQWAA